MSRPALWLAISLAGVGCLGLALLSGPWPLSVSQLIALLTHPDVGQTASVSSRVFWHIRLPRILASLFAGAGLAAAGTAYQGIFRNPLVSPDILGVAAGAGLGACVAIWLELPISAIQGFAFLGGMVVVTAVWIIARYGKGHDPVLTLVLTGMASGTMCGAGISLVKIFADPYTQLPSITFWLLGGLSDITLDDLQTAAPLLLCGLVPLWLLRWRMNLLTLSDEEARVMGLNVMRLRCIIILSATLIAASTVAIAGIIGWIGLVVPHISRLLIGSNHQYLLPASMAIGALMLLLTDTLARSLSATELPLGVLTAFIGAPFFLMLLLRRGQR